MAACLVLSWLALPAPATAEAPEWNVARIHGPVNGAGVVVAVVDTGVDASHPTFGGRVLPAIDLVGGSPGGGDPNGHGTHVAGIVAGGASGPEVGVAPGASILPVRVLGADGTGSLETVDEGIRRAADAGAAVINLSLSDGVLVRSIFGSSLEGAIEYAWSKGAIAVLAAGNHGFLGGLLGSGYGSVPAVVVTATGSDDHLASYATSVGNARWGIAAPGGDSTGQPGQDILSSVPGGYALNAGTSMAAPHVSGTLAALRAAGLSPTQAVDRLQATARPIGARSTYGAGLVDAGAAMEGLGAGGSSAPGPTAPPPTDRASPTGPAPSPSSGSSAPGTSSQSTTTAPAETQPTSTAPSFPAVPGEERPRAASPAPGTPGANDDGVPVLGVLLAALMCVAAWIGAITVARRLS